MINLESKILEFFSSAKIPFDLANLTSFEEIESGTFNHLLAINCPAGKFVLKWSARRLKSDNFQGIDIDRTERLSAEINTYPIFRKIVGQRLIPKLSAVDPQKGFILMEKLSKTRMLMDKLLKRELCLAILEKLGTVLGKIHSATYKLKPTKILLNRTAWAAEFKYHYLELMPFVGRKAAKILQKQIEFHRQNQPVLLHGDLTCRNILVNGRKFYLIDFELSRLGYPSYDIGHFLADYYLLALGQPQSRQKIFKAVDQFLNNYFKEFKKIDRGSVESQTVKDTLVTMIFRLLGRNQTPFIRDQKDKKILAFQLISLLTKDINSLPEASRTF